MAQPGNFTPILLYGSSTPTNVPLAANLTNSATGSEIAINVADKNLFFKDSGGTVNTVPIRQSSTSSNGWLSSTDWNTFNNKSNTNGTVTSVAALTLGTTGTDLSSTVANGTTTPVITLNVPTASAANRGALSAADWSTFNGKQAALVSGTNIKTVGGVTLLGSGDVGTIGTGYGGTGLTSFTSSGVVYASSTSALTTGSALLFNGTFVGVGITPNSWGGSFAGTQYKGGFAASQSTDYLYGGQNCYFNGTDWKYITANQGTIFEQAFGAYTFYCLTTGTAGGTVASFPVGLKVHNSTGVSIGNTTDPGAGVLFVASGVRFPATQVASADANTLDDYEEGTFTATFKIGATTNSTNTGQYTKVGNVVTYDINFYADPYTKSGTGNLTVTGMPFVAKTNGFYMGQVGYLLTYNALINGAAYVELPNASSTLTFYGATTNNIANITDTMISSGTLLIRISGTYLTN